MSHPHVIHALRPCNLRERTRVADSVLGVLLRNPSNIRPEGCRLRWIQATLQPMPKPIPVRAKARALLAAAEPHWAWTHSGLACDVYGTEEPTPAQVSAIRRAVAVLVAEGVAERRERGCYDSPHTHTRRVLRWQPSGEHWSDGSERWEKVWTDVEAQNPSGVWIGRTLTAKERRAKQRNLDRITASAREFGGLS